MAKPILPTPPLEGADAEALRASLDCSASVDEMARRSQRATEALAFVMAPKASRPKR